MTDDAARDLRRFMKTHRIFVKAYSAGNPYPTAHEARFEHIVQLGRYRLSSYIASIDIRSENEPWKFQTKARVRWLSKRASELKDQRRNESGWRLHLENHVLHRLLVEVTW